jgi:hypothetical protein
LDEALKLMTNDDCANRDAAREWARAYKAGEMNFSLNDRGLPLVSEESKMNDRR